MPFDKKAIKSIVKREFLPELESMGFTRRRDGLGGFCINGEFVDVVSLQLSRDVGSVYLHYFRNLLADPFRDLLHAITVGERLGGIEYADASWAAGSREEFKKMLGSIINAVRDRAIPFFDKINDFDEYAKIVEYLSEGKSYPFEMAIVYAIKRDYGKALALCKNLKTRLLQDDEFDFHSDDEDIKLLADLNALIDALEAEGVEALIESWKSVNSDTIRH
jgi:hypothetical protein